MTKYYVYAHPSISPSGIKVGVWYSLEELQERFDSETIKFLFTPANFSESGFDNKITDKQTKTK